MYITKSIRSVHFINEVKGTRKINFVKYSEKMSKGYIKKERLRLLNTKVFFKHSEGNLSYSTYSLSQRGYDRSEVLVNEQFIDCRKR